MFVRILLIAALLWPGFAPAVASAWGPVTPAETTTTCCPLCVMSGAGGCGCGCSVEQEPARPADTADAVIPPDTPRQRTDEPSTRPAAPSACPPPMPSTDHAFDAHATRAAAACAWFCCWQT